MNNSRSLRPDSRLFNGLYRIVSLLGRGGFGITYLAIVENLGKQVAIKEFYPQGMCNRDGISGLVSVSNHDNEDLVDKLKSKFLKEARRLALLKHDSIVSVSNAFEENGTAYYVMDFIEGSDLSSLVKNRGPLSIDRALRYISQIGDALSYLHERHINHLDVKPANVLLDPATDRAVLIDFGLSKHYGDDNRQTTLTPAGVSQGYAPFEQYRPGGVETFSAPTDVYSLGATLFYLLTGQRPPDATELGEKPLVVPSSVPAPIAEVISKAMAYFRANRYQTVTEFMDALEAASKVETAENSVENTVLISSVREDLNSDDAVVGNEIANVEIESVIEDSVEDIDEVEIEATEADVAPDREDSETEAEISVPAESVEDSRAEEVETQENEILDAEDDTADANPIEETVEDRNMVEMGSENIENVEEDDSETEPETSDIETAETEKGEAVEVGPDSLKQVEFFDEEENTEVAKTSKVKIFLWILVFVLILGGAGAFWMMHEGIIPGWEKVVGMTDGQKETPAEESDKASNESKESDAASIDKVTDPIRFTPSNLDLCAVLDGKTVYISAKDWDKIPESDKNLMQKKGIYLEGRGQRFILDLQDLQSDKIKWDEAFQKYGESLPNKAQAQVIADRREGVNATLAAIGGTKMTSWYWTGTQTGSNSAWSMSMTTGFVAESTKTFKRNVRAVTPMP